MSVCSQGGVRVGEVTVVTEAGKAGAIQAEGMDHSARGQINTDRTACSSMSSVYSLVPWVSMSTATGSAFPMA